LLLVLMQILLEKMVLRQRNWQQPMVTLVLHHFWLTAWLQEL